MSDTQDPSGDRRDFLYYATAGTGVVVAGAAAWPLVNSMNPSADVQAASRVRVDVSGIELGTQLTVLFLGKPVFVRRRTPDEIAESEAVELSDLVDEDARNPNMAEGAEASDRNRTLADFDGENTGEWLVQIGVCTHLGCFQLVTVLAILAAGSAPAMARTTMVPAAFVVVRRPKTCTFR